MSFLLRYFKYEFARIAFGYFQILGIIISIIFIGFISNLLLNPILPGISAQNGRIIFCVTTIVTAYLINTFHITNRLNGEFREGIFLYKMTAPASLTALIAIDIFVEYFWLLIANTVAFSFLGVIFNLPIPQIITGVAIVLLPLIASTYTSTILMFGMGGRNIFILLITLLTSFPAILFAGGILYGSDILQNLIIGLLYGLLMIVIHSVKSAFLLKNIT